MHEAFLYDDLEEYLDGAAAFVREGVGRGEPVLVATDATKNRALAERLGRQSDAVRFVDIRDVGRNPARIIPVWERFVAERADPAMPVRGIGEPIWAGRSADELEEAHLHELLLNVAFADTAGFRLLCPYHRGALEGRVLDGALCSYPYVGDRRGIDLSETYRAGEQARVFGGELPDAPDSVPIEFDRNTLPGARRRILETAGQLGAGADLSDALALVAGELCANSCRHAAAGGGTVRLWRAGASIVIEVRDEGAIDDPLAGRRRPLPGATRGYGLWLVNQLCDLVQIRRSGRGTTVRAHLAAGA